MPIHRGPGRESEPDVIERMVMAFLDQYAKDQSNMDAPMLAAVRVLRDIIMERDGRVSHQIMEVIDDHESRAGGKGE